MSANLMSLARSGGKFLKLFGDRKMMKPLPYDAEVEWLECVGLQYIVTDYILSGEGNLFRAGYELKKSKECYLFGNQSGNRNGISISTSKGFELGLGTGYYNSSIKPKLDVFYEIEASTRKGNSYIIANGDLVNSNSDKTERFSGPCFVFSDYYYKSRQVFSYGRLYYLTIDSAFDSIPVRFTNESGVSEGAMYDKVSGQLFRNAGTGAFVIGPDKTI